MNLPAPAPASTGRSARIFLSSSASPRLGRVDRGRRVLEGRIVSRLPGGSVRVRVSDGSSVLLDRSDVDVILD